MSQQGEFRNCARLIILTQVRLLQSMDNAPCAGSDRSGQCCRIGQFGERRHYLKVGDDRVHVLVQQLQGVRVAQYLVLARHSFEGTDMFNQQAVILGSGNTREDQLLTLFGEPVEIDECPDYGNEQG